MYSKTLRIDVSIKMFTIAFCLFNVFSCNLDGHISDAGQIRSTSTEVNNAIIKVETKDSTIRLPASALKSKLLQETPKASFVIDFHEQGNTGDEGIKQGKFAFTDPEGALSFEATASSGYQRAANVPQTQPLKNQGVIPSGKWKIDLITQPKTPKEIDLNKYPPIFRLTPQAGVDLSGLGEEEDRSGFLIHSGKNPLTASKGCIILDKSYRDKLRDAAVKYGSIELTVTNRIY